jgi:hypothetical protein
MREKQHRRRRRRGSVVWTDFTAAPCGHHPPAGVALRHRGVLIMRASETDVGRAWLENFVEVDRPAATMLLDSLRFASLSTLSSGLQARLHELMASGAIERPAMAIPERGLSDFRMGEDAGDSPTAFDDFLPGAPMSVTPGSEGLVGRLLRDFARAGSETRDGAWIAPDATLERLRAEKCRSIVIATDYIGSGDQILSLAAAITRNRTIRSWRSLRLLKIYAVAFAATPAALDRLRQVDEIDNTRSAEGAPSFDTAVGWMSEARETIRQLCATETRIDKKWALGWGETAGLFVSQHGVPNNLPAVFWQGKAWYPLFPWRVVPPEVARQFGDLRPQPPLPEVAEHVGQLRIGRNQRLDSMPPTSTAMLKLLVLIATRPRRDDFFAAQLGIDVEDVLGLRESLEQLGLVDTKGRITTRGRMELAAQKRARRRTTSGISGSDEPYYPRSLR